MQYTLKRKVPIKLSGDENFINCAGKKITVLDLWQYGFSNLNSNIIRGVLAEFIVESAIKELPEINLRIPWEDFDVLSLDGTKIEVKCSAYLQDWDQMNHSKIIFSGLKAKSVWNSAIDSSYKADIYVLALFKEMIPENINILDLDKWDFYILSKDQLVKESNNKSSISLTKLKSANIPAVKFSQIKDKIQSLTK